MCTFLCALFFVHKGEYAINAKSAEVLFKNMEDNACSALLECVGGSIRAHGRRCYTCEEGGGVSIR